MSSSAPLLSNGILLLAHANVSAFKLAPQARHGTPHPVDVNARSSNAPGQDNGIPALAHVNASSNNASPTNSGIKRHVHVKMLVVVTQSIVHTPMSLTTTDVTASAQFVLQDSLKRHNQLIRIKLLVKEALGH